MEMDKKKEEKPAVESVEERGPDTFNIRRIGAVKSQLRSLVASARDGEIKQGWQNLLAGIEAFTRSYYAEGGPGFLISRNLVPDKEPGQRLMNILEMDELGDRHLRTGEGPVPPILVPYRTALENYEKWAEEKRLRDEARVRETEERDAQHRLKADRLTEAGEFLSEFVRTEPDASPEQEQVTGEEGRQRKEKAAAFFRLCLDGRACTTKESDGTFLAAHELAALDSDQMVSSTVPGSDFTARGKSTFLRNGKEASNLWAVRFRVKLTTGASEGRQLSGAKGLKDGDGEQIEVMRCFICSEAEKRHFWRLGKELGMEGRSERGWSIIKGFYILPLVIAIGKAREALNRRENGRNGAPNGDSGNGSAVHGGERLDLTNFNH